MTFRLMKPWRNSSGSTASSSSHLALTMWFPGPKMSWRTTQRQRIRMMRTPRKRKRRGSGPTRTQNRARKNQAVLILHSTLRSKTMLRSLKSEKTRKGLSFLRSTLPTWKQNCCLLSATSPSCLLTTASETKPCLSFPTPTSCTSWANVRF